MPSFAPCVGTILCDEFLSIFCHLTGYSWNLHTVVRLLPPPQIPFFHSYITCVNVVLFMLLRVLFDCNVRVTIDAAVLAGPLTFLCISMCLIRD